MLDFLLSIVETEEDADLVTRLVKEYEKRMFSIAYSVLHNKADAEDAVYDAFLKVVRHLDKIKGKTFDEAGVYISAITRSISIDELKRKKKHILVDPENNIDLFGSYDDVEDMALDNLSYEELQEVLLKLNKTDYEIIYLRYFWDYSITDISDILDISRGAASQRLYAAKSNLKEKLEKRGFSDE